MEIKLYNCSEDDSDEDSETAYELPSRFAVCSRCEGHGTHLAPSIGEHAYSAEEFAESFDEEEAGQYFKRGGIYDVPCEECRGRRVVEVPDEAQISRDPKLAALYARWQEQERESARSDAEDAYTRRMESGGW